MSLPHSSQPARPSATKGRTTISAVTVTYSRSPPPRVGAGESSSGKGAVPSYLWGVVTSRGEARAWERVGLADMQGSFGLGLKGKAGVRGQAFRESRPGVRPV
ncbi:hypothetical protein GCM10012286_23620 [Streptomyces lasiicapitis]|uniref:Uncharacterized protein n=1 Tax=Streptomyces lasiicapitis TaxID=1923961 RepID=A0ABQ2LR82_9ACTN|nr:hypothetical protein GCM10012286_23620 [Streptomyces lasiicapitis]